MHTLVLFLVVLIYSGSLGMASARAMPAAANNKDNGAHQQRSANAVGSVYGSSKNAQHLIAMTTDVPKAQDAKRVSLPELARETIAVHYKASTYTSLQQLARSTPVCTDYKRSYGLFVTLTRNGRTRACWGSVNPTGQDLVRTTIFTTEEALTKEYRFPRIRKSEWNQLKPQVTVIRAVEPIADLSEQNALRYGLLVRWQGRGAVLLPGEASDAHYQLIKCKLKADIPIKQPCQLYRITADVLK
jgi:AMMECR1 domain-containing protein